MGLGPKILSSKRKPLLALFFSHRCPHCSGIPEALQEYANNTGKRDDIYITQIDCYNSIGCELFDIHSTPTQYLIVGGSKRYWPQTNARSEKDWDKWINETWSFQLHKINSSELFNETLKTSLGGSTFYLEIDSESNSLFKKIKKLSRYYHIFNTNFVYTINSSISSPRLLVYTSPYSFITYSNKENVDHFIDSHKFSSIHQFDIDEIASQRSKPYAILYTRSPIYQSQIDSIYELTKNLSSKNFIFGWYDDHSDEKKSLLKKLKISDRDIPFLIGIGKRNGFAHIYKGPTKLAWKNSFLTHVEKDLSGSLIKYLMSFYKRWMLWVFAFILYVFSVIIITKIIIERMDRKHRRQKYSL